MATRAVFVPRDDDDSGGQLGRTRGNSRPSLTFNASMDQTAYFTSVAPVGLTAPLTLILYLVMASGTTGNVMFGCQIEAITPADATDLSSGTSFATTNLSAATAVPGTAGRLFSCSITLTNNDSIAAGDYFRLAVYRDANHASDTATGDCHLLAAELRDAA